MRGRRGSNVSMDIHHHLPYRCRNVPIVHDDSQVKPFPVQRIFTKQCICNSANRFLPIASLPPTPSVRRCSWKPSKFNITDPSWKANCNITETTVGDLRWAPSFCQSRFGLTVTPGRYPMATMPQMSVNRPIMQRTVLFIIVLPICDFDISSNRNNCSWRMPYSADLR